MIILLTIFQYFLQTISDVLDKFLITKRKVEPVKYTFYTVVTGLLLLAVWPWYFVHVSWTETGLSLLSGALFSLAMYVFYVALEFGEVSRVVPFVYGLIPLFDMLLERITGQGPLTRFEGAALWLLIPGAMLIGYHGGKLWTKHVGIKILAALLLSVYFLVWHLAAADRHAIMNNLMWNRIGAAAVLVLPLIFSGYRKKVFRAEHIEHKKNTAVWFLVKQALGGFTFVFLSYLLAVGRVSIINSLQGFRYVFLFLIALFLTKRYRHIIEEDINTHILWQKIAAIILIFGGTLVLFLA